jgi:urease accessory protein UreE
MLAGGVKMKNIWKKWWFWAILVVLFIIGSVTGNSDDGQQAQPASKPKVTQEEKGDTQEKQQETTDKQQQPKKDTEQQTTNKTFLTKDEFNKRFKLDSSEKQYENGKFQLKDGSIINADYLVYGESDIFSSASAIFYQGKLVHLQVETDKSLEEILKGLGITTTKDTKVETQNWGDIFVHDITFDKTFDESNIAAFPNEQN